MVAGAKPETVVEQEEQEKDSKRGDEGDVEKERAKEGPTYDAPKELTPVRSLQEAIKLAIENPDKTAAEGKVKVSSAEDPWALDKDCYYGCARTVSYNIMDHGIGSVTITVECAISPGTGTVCLTGDTAGLCNGLPFLALSWLQMNSDSLSGKRKNGVVQVNWEKSDIHFNISPGATHFCEPHLGPVFVLALISAITKLHVKKDVAVISGMTGEGALLPIKKSSLLDVRVILPSPFNTIITSHDAVHHFVQHRGHCLREIAAAKRPLFNFVGALTMMEVAEKALDEWFQPCMDE